MKKIKYTYITKKQNKAIFWTGCIIGGLMFSIFGGLDAAQPSNLYQGLRDFGLVLLSGTIAFFVGMLCKVDEKTL